MKSTVRNIRFMKSIHRSLKLNEMLKQLEYKNNISFNKFKRCIKASNIDLYVIRMCISVGKVRYTG